MSTKHTFVLTNDLHFYSEAFDEEHVYLSIRGDSYLDELILKIPLVTWKDMRRHTLEPAERYSDMTDHEMVAEAEQRVDEHRTWLVEQGDAPFASSAGMLLYGVPESTREEMIANFLSVYRPSLVEQEQV